MFSKDKDGKGNKGGFIGLKPMPKPMPKPKPKPKPKGK